MKSKLLTLSLIAVSITAMAQYHVRVDCFYNPGDKYDGDKYSEYIVVFTNDNWKTKTPIYEAFDISDEFFGKDVVHQEKIFSSMYTSRHDAIEFAKDFTSYSLCIEYNKRQRAKYYELLAYRNSHPIKIPIKVVPKERCCITTKIY